MTTREPDADAVARHVDGALRQLAASPLENLEPEVRNALLSSVTAELAAACRQDPRLVIGRLVYHWDRSHQQLQEVLTVLQKYKAHLEEQPRLMRVLSEPFTYGTGGDSRRMVYVAPPGRPGDVHCVCLLEDQHEPAVMEYCFTDGQAKFYLAPASDNLPLRQLEQHRVVSAAPQHDGVPLGEVVIDEGMEKQTVLFAEPQLASQIADSLEEGETITVRHDAGFVHEIVQRKGPPVADWLEFPPLDGPGLDELVFPAWLAKEWRKDVRRLVKGTAAFRVALIGPTGVGKTEGVIRAGREAARIKRRQLALIRISAPHVGSSYYSETERTIARAIKQAQKLAADGYVVTALLDEADALLGNSEGRYEGSVDRRVRESLQELLSSELPGVALYATMNPRRDSWLPPAIDRRFMKRHYPRPTRSQMAKVSAGYVQPEALEQLGMKPGQFGELVADFLFNDRFVVAQVYLHSGKTIPVRCRDLHNCSPGKVRDLIITFCEDLVDSEEEDITSLMDLWPLLEREFASHTLNENNLFDMTFLQRPTRDTVKKVEPVRPTGGLPVD